MSARSLLLIGVHSGLAGVCGMDVGNIGKCVFCVFCLDSVICGSISARTSASGMVCKSVMSWGDVSTLGLEASSCWGVVVLLIHGDPVCMGAAIRSKRCFKSVMSCKVLFILNLVPYLVLSCFVTISVASLKSDRFNLHKSLKM